MIVFIYSIILFIFFAITAYTVMLEEGWSGTYFVLSILAVLPIFGRVWGWW